jgi:hypothetical protein
MTTRTGKGAWGAPLLGLASFRTASISAAGASPSAAKISRVFNRLFVAAEIICIDCKPARTAKKAPFWERARASPVLA